MILTQQLAELVEDVHDDMSKGQAGTDTTLFVKTQTGLQTAVAATNLNLSNKTFSSSQVTVTYVIDTSTGNSNDLAEYEVNNGTDSYNRSVKATLSKTSDIELNMVFTFDFEVIT